MTKFILISFGFLAFAFYELSGGADFDGEELRLSRVDVTPITDDNATKVETVFAAEPALGDEVLVTRASFNLVSTDKIDVTNVQEVSVENIQTEASEVTETTNASLAVDPLEEENTSVIILPSLIAQPETQVDETEVVTQTTANTGLDIRSVTANRVNVRGGPGTQYDIVGKLIRGAEVEILSDTGTGWVEMRSVGGQSIGWMADFLLSDG